MKPANRRYFAMQCPECQTRLKVSSDDLGTRRSCPKCKQPITIGKPAPDNVASAKRQAMVSARDEFPVSCKVCGTRFFATPDKVGQTVDCPDCLSEHTVPPPPARDPAPRQASSGPPGGSSESDDYQLRPFNAEPDRPTSAAANGETFHVRCGLCGTTLAATLDLVGKSLTCHDCGSRILVEKPKPKRKEPRVVAQDPKIGIDPAADLSTTKAQTKRLMEEAHAHVEEQERKKPTPPKRPFTDGVFTYPLHAVVALVCLVLTALVFAIHALVSNAIKQEGLAMVSAIPMMVFAAIFTALLALVSGYALMHVLNTSALGYDQPQDWPKFEWAEAVGGTIYLVGAFFVSLLPIMLLAVILPTSLTYPLCVVAIFLLYPFLLMSMLDEGSPAMPFSPHVWRTLQIGRTAWMKFYSASAVVFVIVVAAMWASFSLALAGSFLVAGAIGVGLPIYFRILGRLAFVLDQLPTPVKEDPEPDSF